MHEAPLNPQPHPVGDGNSVQPPMESAQVSPGSHGCQQLLPASHGSGKAPVEAEWLPPTRSYGSRVLPLAPAEVVDSLLCMIPHVGLLVLS